MESAMNLTQRVFGGTGFSLFIALLYLFLYIPIAVLVVFSFNSAPFPAPWKGFSLEWYKQLLSSAPLWKAFYNSLIVSFSATCLSIFMALGLIYYHTATGRLRRLFIFLYINTIVPELVLAVGLLSLFSFFNVPLGLQTLIIAHTVLGFGYAVPIIYTRFLGLDKRMIEASLDLGASYGQTFWRIILPLLFPALSAAGLLVFILSFDDFILSFFCSGSEAQTLSLYIFSMIRSGVSPVVNALSTVLLVLSSLLVIIFCSLNTKTKIF
jgi:spermidine/putrescine transport system permease protein